MKQFRSLILILLLFGGTLAVCWGLAVRSPTTYPSMDSYSWQSVPLANNGHSNNFQITSCLNAPRNMRGWIAFDISGSIPTDALIISAKLRLRVWHKTLDDPKLGTLDTTGRIYGVYRLTQPWKEDGVNWVNQPDYTEIHAAAVSVPPGQGGWFGPLFWMEWDVSDMVKDWQSGTINYGMLVRDTQEDSPVLTSTQFFTHNQVPDETYYPRLLVNYVTPPAFAILTIVLVIELLIIGVAWRRGIIFKHQAQEPTEETGQSTHSVQ